MVCFRSSLQFRRATALVSVTLGLSGSAACGDDDPASDTTSSSTTSSSTASGMGGASGSSTSTATSSTAMGGMGGMGGSSCLEEHEAGDRFPVGDDCNFCDCNADGTTTCTTRTCPAQQGGCTYDGTAYAYAEQFPSTDGCNDCVCAASGLACTRRDCTVVEEGAILVESLDTPCGPDPNFTANAVLNGLPFDDFVAPFLYQTDGPLYPETLPDTTVRVRIVYDGGFAVCRIPNPGQEAFDIEVLVEWMTADGAFDEGFHTYLRRNAGGFTDAWFVTVGAPPAGLDGSYDPACFDDNGFGFDATIYADDTAEGRVMKACETDLLLDVGTFVYP